jgi:CRISPR/Cas system-associated exonuclease Cas4 (RecB family)
MPEIRLPSFPFTPQLGWSTTRSETFRACRRRYFYQYYGKFDSEIPLEQILHLKGLSSIPMMVGTAVHDVLATLLKRLLRSVDPIDRERFARHTERTLSGLLSGLELMETYYGKRPLPEAAELLEPVQSCLERFLASERYSWVRDQLSSDPPWLIEPPGYGETRLRGHKIYAKVDVLIRLPGQTVILDWKSGRQDPAKHTRQLLGYAAWAEHNLQIPAGDIRCVLAYLQPDYQELEKQPSSDELDGLAVEVAAEIQQMQALCRDPERNIPHEKQAFPLTDNAGICRNCQFRELCDRIDY